MPILTPAVAREVRDRIPASTFYEAFDRALREHASDLEPLRTSDRRILRLLLLRRQRRRGTTPLEIAQASCRRIDAVCKAIRRLDQRGLLPDRAAIDYRSAGGVPA